MKRIVAGLMIAAASLLFSAGVSSGAANGTYGVGDYPEGAAANGIVSSRHNLGAYGRVITTSATTEVCIFCHTPHHTNTSNGLIPLWNRGNSTTSFTTYGTTIAGTSITSVGSTTLACLSCHDGITTFDNIVNAPGKDGVIAGGSDRVWNFGMGGANVGPGADHFTTAFGSWPNIQCGFCHTAPLDKSANITRLIIGTVLSDDHPVSVAYNGGTAASLRDPGTTLASIVLTAGLHPSSVTAYDGNLAQNRWAVKGFITDQATIGNLLRNNKVECSSCHDPHFRNLSWDEAEPTWADGGVTGKTGWCGNDPTGENCSDGNFLRRVGGNTGSGVCRTCHSK